MEASSKDDSVFGKPCSLLSRKDLPRLVDGLRHSLEP